MTTEELERDLHLLAEPREDDERFRLAIRGRLGEEMLVRPRTRRRLGRRLAWATAPAAAAATAIVVLGALGGLGGSAGPPPADAAIIHHALVAITSPPNEIVHVHETGVQGGTPISAEWWQQTSAPHALRMIKGPVGQEVEVADDGTTSYRYDASTNTVVEAPVSSAPALVDPIAGVAQQLASGGAQVAGTATIDGTTLYKVELSTGVIAYFDTSDYRPMYLDNPQADGTVVRTRVAIYEELPMTATNANLLSVTAQHPDARVTTGAIGVRVK